MGFINEPIPKNMIRSYKIPNYREITPRFWTIDKERNIFMFDYWTDIDPPHMEYFAFYWNDICFKAVMLSSFIDGYTVEWHLYSFDQAEKKEVLINKQDVLKDLREAFKVYGVSGYSYPVPNAVPRPSTKVVISF